LLNWANIDQGGALTRTAPEPGRKDRRHAAGSYAVVGWRLSGTSAAADPTATYRGARPSPPQRRICRPRLCNACAPLPFACRSRWRDWTYPGPHSVGRSAGDRKCVGRRRPLGGRRAAPATSDQYARHGTAKDRTLSQQPATTGPWHEMTATASRPTSCCPSTRTRTTTRSGWCGGEDGVPSRSRPLR
jgi:hypothetical protein